MVRKPYAGVGAGAGAGAALGMLTGFTAPITMPVMATFAALLGTTPAQSMVDNADSLSYRDSERGQHKDTEHALAVSRSTYVTFSGGKFINKLTFVWSDQVGDFRPVFDLLSFSFPILLNMCPPFLFSNSMIHFPTQTSLCDVSCVCFP